MKQQTAYNLLSTLIYKLKDADLHKQIQKWWISDKDKEAKETALIDLWNDIEQDTDGSTYQSLAETKLRIAELETVPHVHKYQSVFLRIAAGFILMLAGGLASYYYFDQPLITTSPVQMLACRVANGETRNIDLPDGSIMRVNAGSYVIYPDKFEGNERVIYLQGEANFEVVKNPNQRFIVKTPHLSVEALGTKFNVEAYPNSEFITTTLEQGSVKVDIHDDRLTSSTLQPNDQLIYSHLTHSIKLGKVDAQKTALWDEGYIVFQAASFNYIIQTIERRFDVSVEYDRKKYSKQNYTVTVKFSADEDLEQVLKVLKAMIDGFKYEIKGKQVVIM